MFRTDNYEELLELIEDLGIPKHAFPPEKELPEDGKDFAIVIKPILESSLTIFTNLKVERLHQYHTIYSMDQYKAILVDVPIQHGQFSGIDTAALDKRMNQTSWNIHPDLQPGSTDTLFQLKALTEVADPKGKEVATLLMVKHFSLTPFEDTIPDHIDIKQYRKEMIVPVDDLDPDRISFEQASYLLSGGAIMKYQQNEGDQVKWIKLKDGGIAEFPDYNLLEVLEQMPWRSKPDIVDLMSILTDLCKGKSVPASMLINNRPIDGIIAAAPDITSTVFRDTLGKERNWKLWAEMSKHNRKDRPNRPKL